MPKLTTLKKMFTYILLGILVLVLIGFTYEQISRQIVARQYPVQGKLVDVGNGRKIQIDCRGIAVDGQPVVVFESGGDNTGSLSWSKVQDEISKSTQTCSYSRAGIMWSDVDTRKLSLDNYTNDLHNALIKVGVTGKIILVSHSFGGPLTMHYTKNYPESVKGLVFVDTSHPDQISKIKAISDEVGTNSSFQITPTLVFAANLASNLGIIRLFNSDNSMNFLPPEQAKVFNAYGPATFGTTLALNGSDSDNLVTESGDFRDLGDRPLVVLSANKKQTISDDELKFTGQTRDQFEAFRAKISPIFLQQAADQKSWSTNSKQIIVDDSDHFIQLEKPEIVITSIKEVLNSIATGNKLNK
jgi:pimeloyl-ACP methyl ester carboxylesterase